MDEVLADQPDSALAYIHDTYRKSASNFVVWDADHGVFDYFVSISSDKCFLYLPQATDTFIL